MRLDEPPEAGLATLRARGREWLLLLDGQRRPVRWLRAGDLSVAVDRDLLDAGTDVAARSRRTPRLHDTLEQMLKCSTGRACVVDQGARSAASWR